jgi:co-chaperonin GroES (HSP10)
MTTTTSVAWGRVDEAMHTNTENYPTVDAERMQVLGDRLLIAWETNTDEIKAGKVRLVRPETYKKQHFTGIVLARGPLVTDEITVGDRILFSQFSGFEKYFDEKYGRLALIQESKQDSAFAIIPPRVKIASGQGDYDYGA